MLFICSVKADYLIVGQGICGSLLSYELMQTGKKVLVIDDNNPATATRIASGLINPVTGKRFVASWMIAELLPVAVETYKALGRLLHVNLVTPFDILEFHRTPDELANFRKRLEEGNPYIDGAGTAPETSQYFNSTFGTGAIRNCLLVDLQALLQGWKDVLNKQGAYIQDVFDHRQLTVHATGIRYKDIEAGRIILCNGVAGFNNPWFEKLPYTFNKGQAFIASIPGLPKEHIYKQGIKITPWKDDLFWIGASYEWKYEDTKPSAAYRLHVETQLASWLKLPFEVKEQLVAERPATVDYKPFVGFHPAVPQVGIFNGMGSKGCSQAPYFAQQLTQYLLHGKPVQPDVDVQRFSRILCK